ncbi:MAG: hypothetical protein HY782_02645 [Chloroflexi bacterium]|nr:hypothetical protein [Chloroflexota bacterium]
MESLYRFPIRHFEDFERLLIALGTSPALVPGSLRLAEGADLLKEELTAECRHLETIRLDHTNTPGGLIALFRCLWNHPLAIPQPCSIALEAQVAARPSFCISLRLDAPTAAGLPRWVDLGTEHERAAPTRLSRICQALAKSAALTLQQV